MYEKIYFYINQHATKYIQHVNIYLIRICKIIWTTYIIYKK